MQDVKTRWYKDCVIYQIYPRSFKDGNNDGIGDIKGIISKLDYLKELGIDAVWLSPCYKSPNDDNGYDISDYRDIMDEFGTLADWEEMIKGMHDRGIKLIMDLVVNHTSDEHNWFKESRKSKDNPYRDYYIWREGRGKDGKRPPNNWTSRFGGTAWAYDETTKQWYLHLFTQKQPDLNWDNPKVREEVKDLVNYWLEKGVDGFRCDVITYISKTEGLPNGKLNIGLVGDEKFTHGPNIHKYLHQLNKEAFSKYDSMTVGEASGVTIKQGLEYTSEEREELDTVFTFEHVESDTYFKLLPRKFDLVRFKKVFRNWQLGLKDKGWNSLYLENHDQPRSLPRFVGDFGENRILAAKMLATMYFCMQGTPYIFQGQEIGMTNYHWNSLDEMNDVMVKYIRKTAGIFEPMLRSTILKVLQKRARDNARTIMQWSKAENAGFSGAKPWFVINPNYKEINVEDAMKDENSVFNYYKKLIAFRKNNIIIKNGIYSDKKVENKDLFVYERSYNGESLYVICNFKNKEVEFSNPTDYGYSLCKVVLSNYQDAEKDISKLKTLRPYEAMIFHCK